MFKACSVIFLSTSDESFFETGWVESTQWGGGQNLERRNVEQPICQNFKITNTKITKDQLFDSFIFESIFLLFINYLHYLIIFIIVKY